MAQSTWLTDVAKTMADFYNEIQPNYNAMRNRRIAEGAAQDSTRALSSLLATEYPDASNFDPTEIKAREALTSGIGRGDLANASGQVGAPMISEIPRMQAPEPVKASAPMLTIPNQLYAHEAADVASGLVPRAPGSAEYKQSGSSSGATAAQSDESYGKFRAAADELRAKSKALALNKSRLEYMRMMAPTIKAQMFGTEDADAFDKEVERVTKDVEGDEAAQAKALAKSAELEQKMSSSRKQAETQQAKITVAREAKAAADNWRQKLGEGRLDLDWAKLHMTNIQNSARNMLDKYKAELNAWTGQGGTQQLFASGKVPEMMQHLTRGQALIDRLDSMRAATGGALLSKDREQAAAALTEFFTKLDAMAQENSFELMPEQPKPGLLESIYGGGVTAQPTQQPLPASAQFLTGAAFDPIMGGGGSYSTSSASGSGAAPAAPKVPKLGGGKKADGGVKKATSPNVGDKNAAGETWTGKRWLAPKK